MCILLSTTESSEFPFILLSNRDEYFIRPTENARFRVIDGKKILSPADLGREEHGTWIGINTKGKISVLVNYREYRDMNVISEVSRGILPIDYLTTDYDDDEWYDHLEESLAKRIGNNNKNQYKRVPLSQIGGFSLLYGQLRVGKDNKIQKLNIISNRGDKHSVYNLQMEENSLGDTGDLPNTTIGLSNSLYHEPWDKVKLGRQLLSESIKKANNLHYTQNELVEELFKVLSVDTFDKSLIDKSMQEKLMGLRSTIFVPPLETQFSEEDMNSSIGKYYGTRTQTIILLDKHNQLHYYEKDINYIDQIAKSEPKFQYFKVKIEE